MITPVVKRGHLVKKRRCYSLPEKLELIKKVEGGERFSAVARLYSINESTVRTMYSQREQIKKTVTAASPRSCVNVVNVNHDPFVPRMEQALYTWIQDHYRENVPCTMSAIQATARDLYQKLVNSSDVENPGEYSFAASRGWLAHFKKRFNITDRVCGGEALSASKEGVEKYTPEFTKRDKEHGHVPEQDILAQEKSPAQQDLGNDKEETPCPPIPMPILAKFMSKMYHLQDYITEVDPNILRAATIVSGLENAIAPYVQLYHQQQQSDARSTVTSAFRSTSATPPLTTTGPSHHTSSPTSTQTNSSLSRLSETTAVPLGDLSMDLNDEDSPLPLNVMQVFQEFQEES